MYIPESMPGVKLSKFDKTVSAVVKIYDFLAKESMH